MATVISTRMLDSNDFQEWQARFAAGASARADAGCRGLRRFRNLENPDEVIVIFDWDSHDNARRFIESNARLIQARNPDAPPPMIQTIYAEELPALPA